MEPRTAKELQHIQNWLLRIQQIVSQGRQAYLTNVLLQEAGDSLMMKVGEAANRLAKLGIRAPEGVDWTVAVANRNFLIHQYDQVNREQTWLTLSVDLPHWNQLLQPHFQSARLKLGLQEPRPE